MKKKLSLKQRKNIGRFSWLIMFTIGAYFIWQNVDNHYFTALLISIWGSFVYIINPPILKGLKLW